MNTDTGEIMSEEQVKMLTKLKQQSFIPVVRDITKRERLNHQINLYQPCACGSGKKFKFCCHTPRS